jgi:hypothetical protein
VRFATSRPCLARSTYAISAPPRRPHAAPTGPCLQAAAGAHTDPRRGDFRPVVCTGRRPCQSACLSIVAWPWQRTDLPRTARVRSGQDLTTGDRDVRSHHRRALGSGGDLQASNVRRVADRLGPSRWTASRWVMERSGGMLAEPPIWRRSLLVGSVGCGEPICTFWTIAHVAAGWGHESWLARRRREPGVKWTIAAPVRTGGAVAAAVSMEAESVNHSAGPRLVSSELHSNLDANRRLAICARVVGPRQPCGWGRVSVSSR